ncbi:FadR/GntR family transcriptional regulator [Tsukamurella pseudospumae]|uniref:Transcriptional regulator n=1 Tax=Tsukamurella pseudospumae TaxID=239498 RepID=A0A138A8W2_9ACTN|nr:GntR family transcriptional regulator [Tsukamurella pseudospumae]KXO99276.1 transcriptional regulator [Tsukamurella pseudospumae]KXP06844.1 transcriptional regulator [Tsukamurella pseudospumae]
MDVTPIARTAVSDEVLARLVDEILSGRLAPGDALPGERDLAERLGVNRHAVREALKGVRQAGLVQIAQGGKTRVLDWRESAGLDVLSAVAAAGVVPPLRVLRDVTEMRRAIAADAARLCADRASAAHRAVIVELAQGYPDGGYAADAAFWIAVIDGSGNLAYRLALNTLLAGMRGVGERTFGALGLDGELLDRQAHLDLAASIADGDADAAYVKTSELLAGIVSALDAAAASS